MDNKGSSFVQSTLQMNSLWLKSLICRFHRV